MKEKVKVLIKKPTGNIDVIFYHFSNHEIEIIEQNSYYQLILNRKSFLYCEDFVQGLKLLGINEKDVLRYYNLGVQNIFSLLESWIPYGWSHFFANRNSIPKKLTIIHLDDHSDLMSPFIYVEDINKKKNWKDIFTGCSINILNPESIKKAVESGAITLGSILTVLVFAVENINILHLKQNTRTILRYIKKDIESDPLIVPKQHRMSVKLLKSPAMNTVQYGKYIRSSDINELIRNVPCDSDIFLHIDMDFFNNRYNGSTDWNMEGSHDPDINQQKGVINSICNEIMKSSLINKILHVSIGLSPSFYPTEYWCNGLTTVLNELKKCKLKIIPEVKIKDL